MVVPTIIIRISNIIPNPDQVHNQHAYCASSSIYNNLSVSNSLPSIDDLNNNYNRNISKPLILPLPLAIYFPSMVVNLSSFKIYPLSPQLVEKGFNFALVPRLISMEDIIFSIESITHNLPTHEVDEIRQESGRILHHSKPPKLNLTKEQLHSIRRLNDNLDIIVLKADKGNAMVIMNTSNYDSKLLDLISSSAYKPLTKNPINAITSLVTKAIKSSSLAHNILKCFIPHNPQTPRIYGKPK